MAFKPIEILINAKDNASQAIGSLRDRLSAFGDMANSLAGRLAAVFAIGTLARSAAEMETLQAGLTAVEGSAEKAAEGLDFVRRMADAAGVDVVEAGRAFLGLSAATKGTAVEGVATQQVFEAVTIAMAKAGKSSAETVNALGALGQMAGKGTVQMEELRGQLGEALPGALNAAAKGLGITTKELTDLVSAGQITAQDLFPALTKGLNELYGTTTGAQTLSQELTNVQNAFTAMASTIGESGGLTALKTGAEIAQTAITLLGDTLVVTGKSIGVMVAAITTLDFSGVKKAFADIETESRDRLLKAAKNNEVLRGYIATLGNEATKTALATQQAGDSAEKAGQKAAAAADLWVKLSSGYNQVLKSIRDNIDAQEKSVIARDAEGRAALALAAAFGTEQEKRDAQVKAAAANAQELQKLALLRQTELATMRAQLDALQQEAAGNKTLSAERSKQLEELQKQINLRQQDADKATAQAQASRLAAEQARAEAEASRDNSARVGELRAAYEAARAELDRVRQAKLANKATSEAVTQAELALGRAALVYRDALQDQLRAIEAKANVQRADLDVQAATVQLAIEQQRAIYEVARARGDERAAMAAQTEMRRLEIELLRLSAQAKRAEADAALATAEAKRAELIASGEYVGAKKLEIEAAMRAAEVKRLEGQIADTMANKLRDLSVAQGDLKKNTEMATGSLLAQAGALERLGDGVQRVGSGFRNKDGFTSDALGKAETQGIWTRAAIIDYLTQSGLDEQIARKLSEQFVDANGNVPYAANDVQKRWAGRYGTLSEALGKMADYFQNTDQGQMEAQQILDYEKARRSTPQAAGNGAGAPATAGAPARATGTSVGAAPAGQSNSIVINVHGVTDPAKLARMLEPELKRMAALAR
ncbi:tape measure protein [Acidovorax sp. BL-A-41-H1]|uniref:tape measure protein n=1 Tax=Acidovorax sp. BL-A-41-H1 TaxID=3421102 RepID=UPI003F7A91A8